MSESAIGPGPARRAAQARDERLRDLLRKDPALEPWQIAERFGLTRSEAGTVRSRVLQQLRIEQRLVRRSGGRRR
jgi:hypothetical protein